MWNVSEKKLGILFDSECDVNSLSISLVLKNGMDGYVETDKLQWNIYKQAFNY